MDVPNNLNDRCQSCGMPLRTGDALDKAFLGINADGTFSQEYCKFCYLHGAFAEPELAMESMMEKSVSHMTRVLRMPMEEAKAAARATIPNLKRWKRG